MTRTKIAISALILSLGLAAVPQSSQAMMLFNPGSNQFSNPGSELFCFLFLPFCILGEKANVSTVSSQDLTDNGYTSAQIDDIEAGQTIVLNYMKAHGLNQASQMPEAVQSTRSELNSDYLEFVDSN